MAKETIRPRVGEHLEESLRGGVELDLLVQNYCGRNNVQDFVTLVPHMGLNNPRHDKYERGGGQPRISKGGDCRRTKGGGLKHQNNKK